MPSSEPARYLQPAIWPVTGRVVLPPGQPRLQVGAGCTCGVSVAFRSSDSCFPLWLPALLAVLGTCPVPFAFCAACFCRDDVLIVCGDVSDEMAALETALATLKSKFGHVFYVPGVWQRQCGFGNTVGSRRSNQGWLQGCPACNGHPSAHSTWLHGWVASSPLHILF